MSPEHDTEKTSLSSLPSFRSGYCLLHSLKMAVTPWSDSLFYSAVTYRSVCFQILKETYSMGIYFFWSRDGTKLKYTAGGNILSTWPLIEGPSESCFITFECLFHPCANLKISLRKKMQKQTLSCPVRHVSYCLLPFFFFFFPTYIGTFFVDGRFCSCLLYEFSFSKIGDEHGAKESNPTLSYNCRSVFEATVWHFWVGFLCVF